MSLPQQRPTNDLLSSPLWRLKHLSHRVLLRFRDILPECLSSLLPPEAYQNAQPAPATSMIPSSPSSQAMPAVPASSTNTSGSSLLPQIILPSPVKQSLYFSMHKLFKTQMNRFGLFCVYNIDTPPLHDPEDLSLVKNMCSPCVHLNLSTNLYHLHWATKLLQCLVDLECV